MNTASIKAVCILIAMMVSVPSLAFILNKDTVFKDDKGNLFLAFISYPVGGEVDDGQKLKSTLVLKPIEINDGKLAGLGTAQIFQFVKIIRIPGGLSIRYKGILAEAGTEVAVVIKRNENAFMNITRNSRISLYSEEPMEFEQKEVHDEEEPISTDLEVEPVVENHEDANQYSTDLEVDPAMDEWQNGWVTSSEVSIHY